MISRLFLLIFLVAAGCSARQNSAAENAANRAETSAAAANSAAEAPAPTQPAQPGSPQGLPDDRTPVSEAPFAATSAQGAANVVQSYFALLESGRRAEARALWGDGGADSGRGPGRFNAAFAAYSEYHGQVGAPGEMEGAAGSSYVEIPVSVYGRRTGGAAFQERGTITLRRVNDVPGSTAEQRRWHIIQSTVQPALGPRQG